MIRFGVDSFIWSERFSEKDVPLLKRAKELGFEAFDAFISDPDSFPTDKVRQAAKEVGITVVTTTVLNEDTNIISPNPDIRANGVKSLKKLVDINVQLGSDVLGGVSYAAWGYLTQKPRTEQEWDWSVTCMRKVAEYADQCSDIVIALEPVNRFETHFLNIAADAVQYCKDVGVKNMRVHLDSFHMIREETNFTEAVKTCGKDYLGYVHVCESNRGIPGTGLIPWKEFFSALEGIGYEGFATIESFDPLFEELSAKCAIWRKFAESGEQLAIEGLRNLKAVVASM